MKIMFIEGRLVAKKKKYYLVHSYREGDKIKRISRYLGINLNPEQLDKLKASAERNILAQIEEGKADVFNFEFSLEQLKKFEKYDQKIKVEHLQKVNWENFTEEFTYNTNAIEGSHVPFDDVIDILEENITPKSDDEKETVGVAAAVNYIRQRIGKLSIEFMNKLHEYCFKETKSFSGELRNVDVVIRDSKEKIIHIGASPNEVKLLLERLCEWYERHKKKYPPLFLAAMVHNGFEHIHPYQDGNGRVGRLLLNWVLLQHHYPPINIVLKDRKEYYKTLQKFSMKGEIEPTLKFLIKQYERYYK